MARPVKEINKEQGLGTEGYILQLEEKAQNLEMSLNEVKDTADAFYKELKVYKRALELACNSIRDMYCSDYCVRTRDERCKEKCRYEKYYNEELFLDQAKKELEEQK